MITCSTCSPVTIFSINPEPEPVSPSIHSSSDNSQISFATPPWIVLEGGFRWTAPLPPALSPSLLSLDPSFLRFPRHFYDFPPSARYLARLERETVKRELIYVPTWCFSPPLFYSLLFLSPYLSLAPLHSAMDLPFACFAFSTFYT